MHPEVRGECRHAHNPDAAKSFCSRFFVFVLAWTGARSGRCLGRGVFSALRLHQLLWSVRLHLYPAGSFRLPALRAARELFSAACLLHLRLSPGANYGAVSAVNGHTGATVNFSPAHSGGSRWSVNRVTPHDRLKALRMGVGRMADTDGSATVLTRSRLGWAGERNAGNIWAFGA